MERAPLPPHERTWRHPSELGPTAPVAEGSRAAEHGLGTWLATGTLAVIVVAALVVTITPRKSAGPVALTSTTLPAATQTIRSAISTVTTNDLQAGVVALANSVRTARIDEFTAIPSAIASVPGGVVSGGAQLTDIDHAVVVTDNGAVIAVITDGRLVVASDSYGGFTVAAPVKVSVRTDAADRLSLDD